MHKLSRVQMSVVARVLERFAVNSTGMALDFQVLRALEKWIAGKGKHAAAVRAM